MTQARSEEAEEDLILQCAYLVAVGDAHLADEEQQHLSTMRGVVRRMLKARPAIEHVESSGDWDGARELFDPSTPVEISMEGIFGLPSAVSQLHEQRVAVNTQDDLLDLEKTQAGQLTDPFHRKIAYISCMQAALADDELSDAERQTLRIMGEEWDLGHGEAIAWYNNIAFPILSGEDPPEEVEEAGPGSEAARLLQGVLGELDSGETSPEEALAALRSVLGISEEDEEEEPRMGNQADAERPPIIEALESDDAKQFRELLTTSDANAQYNGTPLIAYAIGLERFDMAAALLQSGADINLVTDNGATPLMLAIQNQVASAVEFATNNGADPNKEILTAAEGDHGETISVGIAPLHLACQMDDARIVELLIASGADINEFDGFGFTPLMWAIREHNQEHCQLLIDAGADIDLDPPTDLPANHLARLNPLLAAATNENLSMLRTLCEKGVRTDVTDGTKSTALKHASQQGSMAMVEALIKAGADVNLTDREGWTPLMAAAWREHPPVVRALLAAGANPNTQANDVSEVPGWTPLIAAAYCAAEEIVADLLRAGANMRMADAEGLTALDHVNRHLENAEENLEAGEAYERIRALLQH